MSRKLSNIYTGTVVAVKKKSAVIDLKLKCLYFINIDEFNEEEREDLINKQISVYVPNIDPLVNVTKYASYKKAKIEVLWKQVELYKKLNKVINCKVLNATRGGYNVLLNIGINAFLPSSHTSSVINKDLVGTCVNVKIIGTNKIHKNIVVSIKEVVFEELEHKNYDNIVNMSPGVLLYCLIKGINSGGLFVNIGHGYAGFIGSHDATYQYDVDLSKIYQIGQIVKATVLEIDEVGKKVSLSCLQTQENPFEYYTVGNTIQAVPVSVVYDEYADFTVFMREQQHSVLCKMINLDSRYTVDEINELIKSCTAIECKVKHINTEGKNLIVTTHKTKQEIWDVFYSAYSASEDKIMSFIVHRKSKFMLFARYGDFETTIPITSVHYINTKQYFDNINTGDTIKLKAIHIDVQEMSVVFSARAVYAAEIVEKVQSIVDQKVVQCVVQYFLSERRVVLLIENTIEVSAKIAKIAPGGYVEHNASLKLEVEYYSVENLHIELRAIHYSKVQQQASSMTSVSILDIMGAEIEDLCE